jgi:DNA-binding NarL/FixJ family response regulator
MTRSVGCCARAAARVNYYLRRIYGKLRIRSRIELARFVHGRRGDTA